MMESSFDRAIPTILRFEGGYVNDPDDPGGETKYGISKHSYPKLNIVALSVEHAKEIYLRDFWLPSGAGLQPWPLSLNVFDAAVNNGLRRAAQWLHETNDAEMFLSLREAFFRSLAVRRPASHKYLKGWLRRIEQLRRM